MSKHTPGPWISDDVGPSDIRRYVVANSSSSAGFRVIAELYLSDTWDDFRKEAEANARLIASAPDLLEALEMALDELMDAGFSADISGSKPVSDALIFGADVIAKAKGET
jgi:hypothetical protein